MGRGDHCGQLLNFPLKRLCSCRTLFLMSLHDVIYSRGPQDHFLRISGPAQKAIDGGGGCGGGAEICTISDNRSLPQSLLPPFQTGGRRGIAAATSFSLMERRDGRTTREGGREAGPGVSVMSYEIPSFLRRRRSSVRSRWAMPWVASAFWHFGAPENGSHALTHGSATFTYKRENFPLKI